MLRVDVDAKLVVIMTEKSMQQLHHSNYKKLDVIIRIKHCMNEFLALTSWGWYDSGVEPGSSRISKKQQDGTTKRGLLTSWVSRNQQEQANN
ncbi:unnamed protein product [Boreogadus saida]